MKQTNLEIKIVCRSALIKKLLTIKSSNLWG